MSEFKIHHHAAELLKLFNVTEGDGPEVYAEMLTKDLTPYVTTQISTHTAKRKIAESSPSPEEFLKKYEELKSKNVRELDSFVYLLSNVVQERHLVKFIDRNEKERRKSKEGSLSSSSTTSKGAASSSAIDIGKEVDSVTKSNPKSTIMTQKDVQDLKTKLANITANTSTTSSTEIVKVLREKHAKKMGTGLPVLPNWVDERPFLTNDFVDVYRQQMDLDSVSIGTLPLKMQEVLLIEDMLFLFMGVEGKYIALKDEVEKKSYKSFTVDASADMSLCEIVNRMLPMCSNYSLVCRFIEAGSHFGKGLVSHALCSAMRSLLKDYYIFVAQLEHQFRKGVLTLQKIWFYIQPSMKTIDILATVAMMIERGNCKGAAILTLLHEKTESYTGDPKGKDLCLYLTQAACAPYFDILQKWIYQGTFDKTFKTLFNAIPTFKSYKGYRLYRL